MSWDFFQQCQHEILVCVKKFYKTLFKNPINKTTKDCINFLSTLEIPKLTKTQKAFCENDPTEENLYDALSGMAKEKLPGNDGLTCEFYLTFWEKIKTPFINSLRESKYKKELSSSQ